MNPRRRKVPGGTALLLGGLVAALAASPAPAATKWYVEKGNPRCDNRGAGSSSTPFCTIQTAAKKALAGDTILVRPGTYREEVTPLASGNTFLPITYRATDQGVNIVGTEDVSPQARWTPSFHTSWKQAINFVPTQVFLDGVRLTKAPSASETTVNSFFFDPSLKLLYVDIGGPNPGNHHVVEAGARLYAINVDGVSDIVVDGFTMRSANLDGMRIANTSRVTARNLNISNSGAYGVHVETATGPVLVENCAISGAISNGILVFNTSGMTVRNNLTGNNGFHGISLQNSNNNIVTGNTSFSNTKFELRSATGIDVSMGSSDNLIQANTVYSNQDSGIQIYEGSNGNLVTRNVSWGNGDHGFDTNNSTGTRYISNTSYNNFKDGFSVEGGSTNTILSNNIAVDNGLTTGEYNLYVDGLSATGFASEFDLFWRSVAGRGVRFNGAFYSTITEYSLATNQDIHGINANPKFLGPAWGDLRLSPRSPAIDSADSDAPGFVMTDRFGLPLADDPSIPNTGRGRFRQADRGACESDPLPVAVLKLSGAVGRAPFTVVADGSRSTDNDSIPLAGYTFNFSDSRPGVSSLVPITTHTFAQPGLYLVTLKVTDRSGQSTSIAVPVTVQRADADLGADSSASHDMSSRQ